MQKYSVNEVLEAIGDFRVTAAPLTPVYIASDVDARIAELEKALRRCVDAIDDTYDDDSEAHGLPFELYDAGHAARKLMGI